MGLMFHTLEGYEQAECRPMQDTSVCDQFRVLPAQGLDQLNQVLHQVPTETKFNGFVWTKLFKVDCNASYPNLH